MDYSNNRREQVRKLFCLHSIEVKETATNMDRHLGGAED